MFASDAVDGSHHGHRNVPCWLQAAVRAIAWLRPNCPREPTFATELPLFWIFVSCTPRCGLSGWRCRWSEGDPKRSFVSINSFQPRTVIRLLRLSLIRNAPETAIGALVRDEVVNRLPVQSRKLSDTAP